MVEIVFDELDLEDTNINEAEKPNRILQLYLMFLLWQKSFRISTVGMNILFRFIADNTSKVTGLNSIANLCLYTSQECGCCSTPIGRKEYYFCKWSAVKKVVHSIQLKMQKGC